MARGITLDELSIWLHENGHHTWSLRKMEGWTGNATHLIKYMDIGFDTRTMDIFRIGFRGMSENFSVHVGDDIHTAHLEPEKRYFKELEGKKNSLLDLLDHRIAQILKERE